MTSRHSLPPTPVPLTFFKPPLPGELLYSVILRHHHLSANHKTAQTRIDLFGSAHAHVSGDFPSRLHYFCERTDSDLGTLLRDHTIVDVFRPFTDAARIQKVLTLMTGDHAKDVTNALSIQAGQLNFPAQYRYCPVCAAHDIEQYGVRYLHVEHHLPGVYACTTHRCLLHGYRRSRKFLVLEPSGEALMPDASLVALLRIADWCVAIFRAHLPEIPIEKRISAYRHGLHDHNLITTEGNVRLAQLCTEMKTHWGNLFDIPPFDQFIHWMDNGIFPRSMIYRPQQQYHPIKHVVLLDFLFGNWTTYLEVLARPPFKMTPTTPSSASPSLRDQLDGKIVATLKDNGGILRDAASIHNVSVNFVKSVALRHGIEIGRRRQKITPQLEHEIQIKLEAGLATQKIAAFYGISTASVEHILACHPKLAAMRRQQRQAKELNRRREQWLHHVSRNPHMGRSQLRKSKPSLHSWLYRYDRAWLEVHLPVSTPRNRRGNGHQNK